MLSAFAGQDLATIGESLCCYVPRLLRHLGFEQLLVMSSAEIESLYGTGSWAIDDLIRLLERIADETGALENGTNPEPPAVTIGGDSHVGTESVASSHSPVSDGNKELSDEADATSSEQETASCANDDGMQAEFESLRQVLFTYAAHPLLNKELREFLEPEDTDIPTEFLGNSVREVLETPFVRLARRWVGRGRIRCLLNLLGRELGDFAGHTECAACIGCVRLICYRGVVSSNTWLMRWLCCAFNCVG